jgi:hypothetical protein
VLEFGVTLAYLQFKGDKQLLQNIQQHVSKIPYNPTTLLCHERLAALKIPTLSYSRKRGAMITVFNQLKAYSYLQIQAISPSPKQYNPEKHPKKFSTNY